ncbi:MAG: hypothetical protein JRG97_13000 [Deltaproteobacteria bacterium]|nr:hypothetical protein [Deltaproteobacteria bacterium]
MRPKLIEAGKAKIEIELYGEVGPLVLLVPALGRGAADYSELGPILWLTPVTGRRLSIREAPVKARGLWKV